MDQSPDDVYDLPPKQYQLVKESIEYFLAKNFWKEINEILMRFGNSYTIIDKSGKNKDLKFYKQRNLSTLEEYYFRAFRKEPDFKPELIKVGSIEEYTQWLKEPFFLDV